MDGMGDRFGVVPESLTVSLGSDTLVPRNGSLHLHAIAHDGPSRILAYAWDIGKTGVFVPGSGPDTVFTAPAGFDHIPCIVRVTDDRGNTATATRNVDVSLEWQQVQVSLDPSLNVVAGAKAVEFQGRFWLIGDRHAARKPYMKTNCTWPLPRMGSVGRASIRLRA